MKRLVLILILLLIPIVIMGKTDTRTYTTIGQVALTITNFGVIGNGFRVYDQATGRPLPSCEYPKGSGIEHLYRAGLWVGAVDYEGDTLVTTGVSDASAASPAQEGFEFYPTDLQSDTVIERSILLTSPYYSPDAVSEQDFFANYGDDRKVIPHHTPLHLEINQYSYAWSYSYADDFVILQFVIKNNSPGDLDKVYVGMYAELVSASRKFWGDYFNSTTMFQHKRVYFDDTLRMMWEKNDGYDTLATQVIGIAALGFVRDGVELIDSLRRVFQWWSWRDMQGSISDVVRYQVLSADSSDPNVDEEYVIDHGYPDPICLLSIGDSSLYIPTGDSIIVTFAIVLGENYDHMLTNYSWAKRAYEAGFQFPAPPPSPVFRAIPGNREVTLFWDPTPEEAADPYTHKKDFEGYRIYRRSDGDTTWILLAQFDILDTIGFNTGLPELCDTPPYRGWRTFKDVGVKNGHTYVYSITSFDTGDPELGLESLESAILQSIDSVVPSVPPEREKPIGVYPNPYRLRASWDQPGNYGRMIRFTNLPRRATLYIYNIAGDLVKTIEHDDPYSGEASWNLVTDQDKSVAPGLYYVVVVDRDNKKVRRARFLIIK